MEKLPESYITGKEIQICDKELINLYISLPTGVYLLDHITLKYGISVLGLNYMISGDIEIFVITFKGILTGVYYLDYYDSVEKKNCRFSWLDFNDLRKLLRDRFPKIPNILFHWYVNDEVKKNFT